MKPARLFNGTKSGLRQHSVWMIIACGLIAMAALRCTRPELIGSDLLKDETSELGFTDTVSLLCKMEAVNAVKTFSTETGLQITRNLVGHLDDPYFGKADASCYTDVFLLSTSSAFLGQIIDSVVLTLRYDTLGSYGDLSQPVEMGVYLMTEALNEDADIYSDYAPMTSPEPIALQTITPGPKDSLTIISRGDTVHLPPMVRLRLNPEFIANMQMQDSSTFQSADTFKQWLPGLNIRMTQAENTMLGFNLNSGYSGVTIYYRSSIIDSADAEISFGFTDVLGGGTHHELFSHDYSGSLAAQFLENPALSDSLLFLEGMSGINVAISIPGLPNINNIQVNKAELVFYAAELSGDDLDKYPRVPQLVNGVKDDNGDIVLADDVSYVLQNYSTLIPYGGNLMDADTTTSVQKYVLNVTRSLQDIYKGRKDPMFYIIPFSGANQPNRVILYGAGNSMYPARLRLTYTIVQ